MCFLYHTIGAKNPLLRTDFVCFLAAEIKNRINIKKMQKKLDKRRKHVLNYLTLIQYLVHSLETIHNIWIGAIVLLLHFPEGWTSAVVRTEES